MENDFAQPQAGWSAYRDLAFGQAEFTILNTTSANWTWKADDGTPVDQVGLEPQTCLDFVSCHSVDSNLCHSKIQIAVNTVARHVHGTHCKALHVKI